MGRESPFVSLEQERLKRADDERAAVPFLILTGFLGAGKTTLLNRLLSAPQGQRIAVLVNDIGQINVDRKLLERDAGDLIELSGGCVCCAIDLQRDLFSGIDDLVERAKPDVVILETTGIADPSVLIAAFDEVADRRRLVVPAGVITVVDAEVGVSGSARAEWGAQIAAADRIVLTKLERASDLDALHARLATINAEAERAAFPDTEAGTQDLARFLLERRAPKRIATTHSHSQLSAYAFSADGSFLEAPLLALVESIGDSLVRLKGYVRIANDDGDRWAYLERAGRTTSLSARQPPADETRTELVFIVEADSISEAALRRRLWACRIVRP